MKEITIHSQRLSLKPFTANDADECFACMRPTLTRFMSWEPPKDETAFEVIWRVWLQTIEEGSDFIFVIRDIGNSEF